MFTDRSILITGGTRSVPLDHMGRNIYLKSWTYLC